MKISLALTTKKLSKATKAILIINLLSGCAGIPAGKVKLDDYPKISDKDAKNLKLIYDYDKIRDKINNSPYDTEFEGAFTYKDDKGRFRYGNFYEKNRNEKYFDYETDKKELKNGEVSAYNTFVDDLKKRPYFDYSIVKNLKSKNLGIVRKKPDDHEGCLIKLDSLNYTNFPAVCVTNFYLSFFTLFTLPYYCQEIFEANATLISYPQDSQIHGTIKTSIREAKIGDIFLDENDRPAKILKTYELKDKVHEIWSSLWMLSWLVVEPNKYSSIQNKYLEVGRHPDVAKTETENTISEALVRQVLHDASTFEECQKTSPSNIK